MREETVTVARLSAQTSCARSGGFSVHQKRLRARGRNGEFKQSGDSRQATALLACSPRLFQSFLRPSADSSSHLPAFDIPQEPVPPVPELLDPPFKDLLPEVEAEVLAEQEFLAVGPKKKTIHWGPSCFNEQRNYFNDARIMSEVSDADYSELLEHFYSRSHNNAVAMLLLPAVESSCDTLKGDLFAYLDGNLPTAIACAKALVFYRRHSFHLEPHLSSSNINFYESMCDLLPDFFRTAGHRVRTPHSSTGRP